MAAHQGIGPWTLGKDLVSFTIVGVAVTAATVTGPDGTRTTWTAGTTPIDCHGIVRRLSDQYRVSTKDIRPITQVSENMVPVSVGSTLQITQIRVSDATNALSDIIQVNSYVQVIWQDSHEKYDGYYVITGYESGFDGNEEQIASVDLGPVALTDRAQVVRTVLP